MIVVDWDFSPQPAQTSDTAIVNPAATTLDQQHLFTNLNQEHPSSSVEQDQSTTSTLDQGQPSSTLNQNVTNYNSEGMSKFVSCLETLCS